MDLIVLIIIILLIGFNLFLYYFPGSSALSPSLSQRKFSIIIAIKNAQKTLPLLISSLKNLNYLPEYYEVIFVDDSSTDNSRELIELEVRSRTNFRLIDAVSKSFPGKKGALDLGLRNAKNEFIITTDADCRVPPGWLNVFNRALNDGSDMIFGHSPFADGISFISKLSRFENLRSSLLSFTAAWAKIPYSASARNLCFRRKIFYQLGGYSSTLQTLSGDDDLLLREAAKTGKKISFLLDTESFVITEPENDLKGFILQKSRHTSTSHYYLPSRILLLGLWHCINLSALLLPFFFSFSCWFSALLPLKLLMDIAVLTRNERRFSYKFSLVEKIILQISYEILLIIIFIFSFFRKKSWN